ncbi:MAG: DUF5615 family PIN-like protein [Chloroflexi bacterium]|nr:DUF5615 family PIN-like protein [Chloroflexota bacterium]
MKLVADENIDVPIVDALRGSAHEVVYVAELDPSVADEVVLDVANRGDAVLLTADTDFGELIFRRGMISGGVILVRLAGLSSSSKADIVVSAIAAHGNEMVGRFTVLSGGGIRIRRL